MTQVRRFDILDQQPAIRHFVSTRHGGVSDAPYSSLNVGLHVSDDQDNVIENRQRLLMMQGISLNAFTAAQQVHGDRVAVVSDAMRGMGSRNYQSGIESTDALITNESDICLVIFVADCTPILLFDPQKRVIGAVHAGWKGTVSKIVQKTVIAMQANYGCNPSDILAGIGPSIGPCCYQVGDEVAAQVESQLGDGLILRNSPDDRGHLNMWEANRRQLEEAGLRSQNIEVSGRCTCCNVGDFFSYRKEGITGRFMAAIMLNNEICAECTAMHCSGCQK